MAEVKTFDQVFPDFNIPENLRYILCRTRVEKIVMKKSENKLVICTRGEHVLSKKTINKIAFDLKRELFGSSPLYVEIEDRYDLSELYTPRQLVTDYIDSIHFELEKIGKREITYFKKADWDVSGNVMTILMEDSFMAKKAAEGIKTYLEDLFADRFGLEMQIGFNFTEAAKETFFAARERELQNEVGTVMDNIAETVTERPAEGEISAQKAEEKKKAPRQGYNSNFFEERARSQEFTQKKRRGKDPDCIYGKDCDGDVISIHEITGEIGQVVIRGQVFSMDIKEIRRERSIISFAITDDTDSIMGKIFLKNEELPDFLDTFKKDGFYLIKGMPLMDTFEHELTVSSIQGIKPIADFRTKRMDKSPDKRVELHLHTVMSDNDSVVDIKKMIKTAKSWGHKAVAITDHGVLQAFPIANHCIDKEDPFKIIYGVEGYFVDDLKQMVEGDPSHNFEDTFVVFDLETTGFSPLNDEIIEIGAVKIRGKEVVDHFSEFVNPCRPIPARITELTSIDDTMVKDAPPIEEILPRFLEFVGDAVLVAHNASFDVGFTNAKAEKLGYRTDFTVLDTLQMARLLMPELSRFKLNTICKALKIKQEHHHRAVDDARVTAEILLKFMERLAEQEVYDLRSLNELSRTSAELIKKSPAYHGIILIQNETGRVNLNRLVSASHLDYFHQRPKIPMSLIRKYREGLILGSACEAGQLFRTIVRGGSEEELARLVDFFDYLEIQPIGNNAFMLRDEKQPAETEEDLRNYNRQIVELGKRYGKPVVATCDVHFLNPEDEVYRRILMGCKGFADADQQAPLYFRTTEEMLEEFAYLGEDTAREVVIDNTNLICDRIEKISPVHPDKCPPVIPDSDETLKRICYDKAHEIYGPELPPVVVERLERELHSIISNGFAVMYIIAQKLVWDSNDHGYLVGSRGSVGSSLVATMAGITEVNPLSAHYICPECHYYDFDSDEVKAFVKKGMSGCDMPDRNCPVCGHPMKKEGHDIPFETFLGFKGNKEPDIDLNFSGEYQSKAHKYVEVIFGEGTAFRAGTIGTIADKTAIGYVLKYNEERGISMRRCEVERIAKGCEGVKRTTGQHPGGIIVVPHEREIYEFTAIQHPANDVNSDIVTTHFEYHSIDHNLLKLDILGHDDPTMIKRMTDMTGIDAKTIPLDDKDVIELFHSTKSLGVTPEDLMGIELGSMGVPEFGTEFVMQMLKDTKPRYFSDLVRISGLSHGTDVWLGNAQTIIEEGIAEIGDAICCRDDIMVYLINMGMEKEKSFTIMESVRKGKGLKDEWIEDMIAHDVPQWYIDSCLKIKYMFPKAHAAAYVMMALRIAWFKVHYPLAYYAAYFGIRASAFNYEFMCMGREKVENYIRELTAIPKDQQSKKEQDCIKDARMAQEMYARGFEFMPIDIYKAKARECQIIDGKIMPPLSCVDGLGDKAGDQVEEAAKKGTFTSLENFRNLSKVSKTVVDKLVELGILTGLPETDQLSFADMLFEM